ncbi:MAG: transmembrane 220 family protein [Saprospiraceae bacterium]|nr:transmembrane 220 family protein [Saprospiraceae bacterium]
MKYIYLVLALMFVLFALVQYNDPDPYIWAPYYLLIAAICFIQFRQRKYPWLVWSALLLTIAWSAFYIPDVIDYFKMGEPNIASEMKATTPYIENMREFLGLVICLITLGSILIKKGHYYLVRKNFYR